MTGAVWPSALVALLCAVHPLRAEAVAWIGERKTPLSGLFFCAASPAAVSGMNWAMPCAPAYDVRFGRNVPPVSMLC